MIYVTNDKRLMRVAFYAPDVLKRLILSPNQRMIIKIIREHDYPTISSRELAYAMEISVQSAGAQLNKLYVNGWLEQETRTDPTGGILYRYKLVKF